MSRMNSVFSDKNYNANCYEYIALRPGFANANYVGESANPIYNGIKPSKYPRSAPIPVSLDVLAVNQSKLYSGNRQNIAREIIQQYVADEKTYKNPIVVLEDPRQTDSKNKIYQSINQAANIARPNSQFRNRGDDIATQTISQDALNNSKRLQDYEVALLKLNAPSSQKVLKDIQAVADNANISLASFSPYRQTTREGRVDATLRNIEALLAVGADVSVIDSILSIPSSSGYVPFNQPPPPAEVRSKGGLRDILAGIRTPQPIQDTPDTPEQLAEDLQINMY